MKFKLIKQVLIIMAGLTLYSFGFALFVLPLDMIGAGTSGLALLANKITGIPLSAFAGLFNVLMFVVGWIELGRYFAFTTLVSTFYFPFILEVAIRVVGDFVITRDPILCAVFSGIIIGLSLGSVIRAGASTGGMDIPPLVLKKRFNIPISVSMYMFDAIILISQMFFGDQERILYALVMVMVYTMVVDKVLMVGTKKVQVKIFSEKYQEISLAIQERTGRGTSLFYMEGGHTGHQTKAVVSIVSSRELSKINEIVTELDDKAFMVVNQVGEVRGRGFTLPREYV